VSGGLGPVPEAAPHHLARFERSGLQLTNADLLAGSWVNGKEFRR
jgi:hypothetical protein